MFVGAMVDDNGCIQTRDVSKHVNIMISVFLFAGNQRLAIIHELSRVKNDDVLQWHKSSCAWWVSPSSVDGSMKIFAWVSPVLPVCQEWWGSHGIPQKSLAFQLLRRVHELHAPLLKVIQLLPRSSTVSIPPSRLFLGQRVPVFHSRVLGRFCAEPLRSRGHWVGSAVGGWRSQPTAAGRAVASRVLGTYGAWTRRSGCKLHQAGARREFSVHWAEVLFSGRWGSRGPKVTQRDVEITSLLWLSFPSSLTSPTWQFRHVYIKHTRTYIHV